MYLRRSFKLAEDYFRNVTFPERLPHEENFEEWYFKTAELYEKANNIPDLSLTPTFWRWYKHVMLELFEDFLYGRHGSYLALDERFLLEEFRIRPVPPMIEDKMISEFFKTPKFKQYEKECRNTLKKSKTTSKTTLKAF